MHLSVSGQQSSPRQAPFRAVELEWVYHGGQSTQRRIPAASSPTRHTWDLRGYAWALVVTLVATAIGWPLHHELWLANTNVLMVYLLGVLYVATRHSRSAAVLASVLGVAAFNFFFVPPHLTFIVSERQYLFTFAVMLVTALVISALTHRVRSQAEVAGQRERRTLAVFALSRDLAAARTIEEVVTATLRNVTGLLGGRSVILLPDGNRRLVVQGDGSD